MPQKRTPISDCAPQDQGRFADPAKNKAFYKATQTDGLLVVFANNAEGTKDVAKGFVSCVT